MKTKDIILTPTTFHGNLIKNQWDCTVAGRKFQVHKSSFGWHVGEHTVMGFVRSPFAILYDSKTEALQAIIDGTK